MLCRHNPHKVRENHETGSIPNQDLDLPELADDLLRLVMLARHPTLRLPSGPT